MVTVDTASSGLICSKGLFPAASTTIMVSPIARDAANKNAPIMPGKAAGITTWRIVSDFVAPKPSEPSRSARGT